MTKITLRIALAQINTIVGDISGNQKKIAQYIGKAKANEADVVTFPELAITGYPPEDLLYKDNFVKDNLRALQALAKSVKDIIAIVGFVDMDKNKKLFNAAAIISGGRVKGVFHKKDLPNYGVFDEKRYFKEGNTPHVYSLGKLTLGVNICEDIWNDQGMHRWEAQAGADVLINISSSPYDLSKLERRKKLLTTRARQNKAFICYTNLVGGQDELVFDGASMIVDPQGKIIANARQFEEDLLVADLEIKKTKPRKTKSVVSLSSSVKPKQEPVSRQLSPWLSQTERIYKALVLGTRDYVEKNGFKKVVVGLSGGVDSALVATIAVEALGKDQVIGISMPSRFSSAGTQSDAKQIAKNLGIKFLEIPIEPVFVSFNEVLQPHFGGLPFNIAEENLQARIRGTILMAFSNKFGWLVLTTGNKSEIAVGYCTLYGDMSGGFAVIKDVPKTKVYEIAELINAQGGEVIPKSIIERAPTAELRENQCDQDSLPPYPVLDQLLKAYVEEHRSVGNLAKLNSDKELIQKVIGMIDRSEYKRRQAPPGVKITPRAFGKDWRLPITNRYKNS
jgi:NAD+ synthase (glutamine-hydrolysing)